MTAASYLKRRSSHKASCSRLSPGVTGHTLEHPASRATHRHLHLNLAHRLVSLDDKVVELEPVDILDLVEGTRDLERREWARLALELGLEAVC